MQTDSTVLWQYIGSSFHLTNTCHCHSSDCTHMNTHTHTHTQSETVLKIDKTIFIRKKLETFMSLTHTKCKWPCYIKPSNIFQDRRMFPYSILFSKRQRGLFRPAKKWPKHQANLTTQLSTENMNVWSFTSALSHDSTTLPFSFLLSISFNLRA